MEDNLRFIENNRVVIIYRGMGSEECLEVSRALMDAGVHMFEVTMNSPDTAVAIRLLDVELGSQALIGAGTVLTTEHVEAAADAGASYIISPNTDFEVIRRTKELGMVSVPGAFTPTEVRGAWEAGADIVKVFPINVVGAQYITQLKGPLDDIPLMPSGGITTELAEELSRAGVAALGVGVQMLGKDLIGARDWNTLRDRASELITASEAGVRL